MSTVINNKRETNQIKQNENVVRIETNIKNIGGFSEYLDITYPRSE